jgi:hypothetical protein
MSKPENTSKHSRTDSYFDNPDRKKDTDFTEVLNLQETYEDLMKQNEENPSDTQIDITKKASMIFEYRRKVFFDHLAAVNQKSYIDLNVII